MPPDPPKRLAFSAPGEVYVVETPGARGAFLRHPDGRIAGLFWSGRFYVRRDWGAWVDAAGSRPSIAD